MKLVELQQADIYRDGGSYGARFLADDAQEYGLWLQRSRMPDEAGIHDRWLFQYPAQTPPDGCIPVVSGSADEAEILRLLDEFLQTPVLGWRASAESLSQLREMRKRIPMREACSPDNVLGHPYSAREPVCRRRTSGCAATVPPQGNRSSTQASGALRGVCSGTENPWEVLLEVTEL
jgi:hypothetical protein